ncbi:hypothetical protein EJV47_22940 [Hymenobacter gummosus]|uniref:Uncharacterized protein n=1 Tax=Hymenobacter gummosus TaxID=1776032 RepID=A0A3S0JDS6_9BACT|nr:hypothetical protein [Hymenobacter gummosus]RTQ46018.1 hypothetical protein EJV47_22940 [Hymenobacter gummosus]
MPLTQPTTLEASQTLGDKTRIAALNATILYVLAYLTADFLSRLLMVLTAAQLHIPSAWHLGRVQFRIADADWWRNAVVAVYSAGPLACLLLAVGAGLWCWRRARQRRGLLKQYLVWLVLHGFNLFFGALIADTFTRSGFWFVPAWLFLAGNGVTVALAVLFGLVFVVLGYFTTPLFLQSHDSRTLMRYPQRRRLLLATLLTPWLAGSLLLAAFRYPELTINEELRFVTLLLALGPIALASANELFEFTVPVPQKTRVAWGLVVVLAVVLVVARLALGGPGILFG